MTLYAYRKYNSKGYVEYTEEPEQPYTIVEVDDGAEEMELQEKQKLLDHIQSRQQQLLSRWDAFASKTWAAELFNKANKQTLKEQARVIDPWSDAIRLQNNDISVSNTLAEIQARLTRLDELEASYPNV